MKIKRQCKLCGKIISNLKYHLEKVHKENFQDYYDKYLLVGSNICPMCNTNKKSFYKYRYKDTCSTKCGAKLRAKQNNHDSKVEKFEIDNNCTSFKKLRDLYGIGWSRANLDLRCLTASIDSVCKFVLNDDIYKVVDYFEKHKNFGKSKLEDRFIEVLDNIDYIRNSKAIIYPCELDIYIPSLNLAVEINGEYYHSFEKTSKKDYHIKKSILCKNKNIRLIHVYEFEDINKQVELLRDLVRGIDNYHKQDFNKNNLINSIPKPYKYITNRGFTIYTAGKLY